MRFRRPAAAEQSAEARAFGNLYATKVLACGCGAPGTYHDRVDEPRCYAPERKDENVGAICPCCGAKRPADQPLGKIWSGKIW
jgi:hypothetical protein